VEDGMGRREDLVKEKIDDQDFMEIFQLRGVREIVYQRLTREKGYSPSDILIDQEIHLTLGNQEIMVSTDFIIMLDDIYFSIIKCIGSGVEAWVRYTTAFARTAQNYQIPLAMVTDGEQAALIDTLSGNRAGDSFDAFPERLKAEDILKDFKKVSFPKEKLEKEIRIVYAFEGLTLKDK
jgi:hypothetical protein